jgi:hypothetical protein
LGVVIGAGYAGPGWEWPGRPLTAILELSCCRNIQNQGGSSEQIPQIITHDMALSVSHCMGSQVPLSDIDRSDQNGLRGVHPCNLRIYRMRSGRVERATGPFPSDRNDSSEDCGIAMDGSFKRPKRHANISTVPASAEAEILRRQFLVQRLLCWHGWFGCGRDTQICPLPGKERASTGAAAINRLSIKSTAQREWPAPDSGPGPCPPYGGIF